MEPSEYARLAPCDGREAQGYCITLEPPIEGLLHIGHLVAINGVVSPDQTITGQVGRIVGYAIWRASEGRPLQYAIEFASGSWVMLDTDAVVPVIGDYMADVRAAPVDRPLIPKAIDLADLEP